MESESAAEEADEEKRLSKLKKRLDLSGRAGSAMKSNATMRSGGYDHSEGPDFDNIQNAASEAYTKHIEEKGKKKKVEESEDQGSS